MNKHISAAEMGALQSDMQKRIQKYIQREVNNFHRDTGGLFVRSIYVGCHDWFTADGDGTTIGPVTFEVRLP